MSTDRKSMFDGQALLDRLIAAKMVSSLSIAASLNLNLGDKQIADHAFDVAAAFFSPLLSALYGDIATLRAERDTFREHSVTLNSVGYRLAQALAEDKDADCYYERNSLDDVERLCAEVERLRKENEYLRSETPHLISAGQEDGKFAVSVKTGHDLMVALAAEMSTLLETEGGPNYVEWTLKPAGLGEPYRLILVRPGGRSPHELRMAVQAERDSLLAAAQAVVDAGRCAGLGSVGVALVAAVAAVEAVGGDRG